MFKSFMLCVTLILLGFCTLNCGATPAATNLTDCEETDLPAVPGFFGSAVETGKLTKKPGKAYMVVATHFLMSTKPNAEEIFQNLMNKVQPAIQKADGLLGASLTFSHKCKYGRTLTVWKDEASMMKFVTTGAHGEAVKKTGDIASHFRTVHWQEQPADWPPTWKKSKEKLAEIPSKNYVK